MDAVGTAHLTSDILAQRAVGARVSRRQITDVLHEPEGAPELVLDLVAAEGGEHATVSMTWSRDDLEQLLESASGDEMVLVFDRDELAGALDDVEAHGPRARAAMFAVAAAGALGSGASIANAAVMGGDGGGSAGTPVAAATADESAAVQARSEALNQQYGLGSAGAAENAATEARSEALNQQYGLGTAGAAENAATEARSEALNQQYGLGTAGAAENAATEARSEALNQQYGLGTAGAAENAATEARSEALNQQYGLGSAGAAENAATEARSEALNQQYGLGDRRRRRKRRNRSPLRSAQPAIRPRQRRRRRKRRNRSPLRSAQPAVRPRQLDRVRERLDARRGERRRGARHRRIAPDDRGSQLRGSPDRGTTAGLANVAMQMAEAGRTRSASACGATLSSSPPLRLSSAATQRRGGLSRNGRPPPEVLALPNVVVTLPSSRRGPRLGQRSGMSPDGCDER